VRWSKLSTGSLVCALVQDRPLQKTWSLQLSAAQAVVWLGVIRPRLAREAIPQLAGRAELVLGDKDESSVRADGPCPSQTFPFGFIPRVFCVTCIGET